MGEEEEEEEEQGERSASPPWSRGAQRAQSCETEHGSSPQGRS